jgi:ABC-type Zn uptake system ZnuABC Zn-binding protein ZnuA
MMRKVFRSKKKIKKLNTRGFLQKTTLIGLNKLLLFQTVVVMILLSGCSGSSTIQSTTIGSVLVVETFLADMTQNVAGDRMVVETLLPIGVDLHSYQPSPRDVIKVSRSSVLVISGGGIEAGFLTSLLENAGGKHSLITASDGIAAITGSNEFPQGDPHFWLDPIQAIQYVENIRDGLIKADPDGEQSYRQNADNYIKELNDLDTWIKQQVDQIPIGDRKLITNHDSLGYFARRYGFEIIGSLIPGLSSEASPTARDLINLVEHINSSGAKAIFLETGVSTKLADQISSETNVTLVTDLYIGSLSQPDGPAPTYIEMMKYDVTRIVDALK